MSLPLRIQRDIAVNVTIDEFIWPALDMSTAFFGTNYTQQRFSQIDQPLWMGYKRIILDLYWNSSHWQLCPTTLHNTCPFTFTDYVLALNGYLESTAVTTNPIQTNLITLILNLHNNSTAKTTTDLSSIILRSVSPFRIYTPSNLTLDRVNTTLLSQVVEDLKWPPLLYIIKQKVQLLIGLGETSSSFSVSMRDKSLIFGQRTLTNTVERYHCQQNPTSWTFVSDAQVPFTYNTSSDLVRCGYSPVFTHSVTPTDILSTEGMVLVGGQSTDK
ncbi:hypothetical protein HPULCUR_005376 [Helicostylum pulchrum]|uniref:Maintenance of telomere capping protein 6 n=1 Tax=Helicostylum pulchrum TaxID=562976 RepID=A0ABP9Y068_9FUNG